MAASRTGDECRMATALRDRHDHNVVVDVVGLILAVAVAVLLVVATFAAVGLIVARWAVTI